MDDGGVLPRKKMVWLEEEAEEGDGLSKALHSPYTLDSTTQSTALQWAVEEY
jgi:hypothetical protein